MRLLALSDIHNNLASVRRLRDQETNAFDAIVVAGDMGNAGAASVLEILATFQCPIVYVYGNWDNQLEYSAQFGTGRTLLHLNVVTIGGLHFTGFSGCPTHWGRNPVAVQSEGRDVVDAKQRILDLNRRALRDVVVRSKLDPRRIVVVTHERLARLPEVVPGALLHLYGHIHQFSTRQNNGTTLVNVSVLDRVVSCRPDGLAEWQKEDLRNFNAGNYATIEIRDGSVTVTSVPLWHDYPDWIPLEDRRFNGLAWIPEETQWAEPSDPRLMRFQVRLPDS